MRSSGILGFLLDAGKLKRLPRTGWLMAGIPNPESVADHSFRTALVAMILCDELVRRGVNADCEKTMRMALLHDIGEALTSDIPSVAAEFVGKKEEKAVERVLGAIPTYKPLWEEYERGESLEGKTVKFADRLEMLIQALEYERAGFRGLDDFWGAVDELRSSDLYPFFDDVVEKLVEMHREVVGCSQNSGKN
ncbi:MAG: HD family hydrolase [Thermococci archaeon]|nr:HD family hydrolase [Thermococci archaeon]